MYYLKYICRNFLNIVTVWNSYGLEIKTEYGIGIWCARNIPKSQYIWRDERVGLKTSVFLGPQVFWNSINKMAIRYGSIRKHSIWFTKIYPQCIQYILTLKYDIAIMLRHRKSFLTLKCTKCIKSMYLLWVNIKLNKDFNNAKIQHG